MSEEKKVVLEGPDGILYEIPADVLAKFAVPGPRVNALRERLGKAATTRASAPAPSPGGATGGELPPGHHRMPPVSSTAPVVLNIYIGGGAPPAVNVHQGQSAPKGVEGHHLAVDEQGIPHSHSDMLWGDYIDKQGRPAVGYHSHDPVHGNAQ